MNRSISYRVILTPLLITVLIGLSIPSQTSATNRSEVENFVTRFYQLCLDRDPDAVGLKGWTDELLNQTKTGAHVAEGFIYSAEFIAKNTTNSQYLLILYKAFFDREPDQAGWDTWLAELNSVRNRGEVLNGFIYSEEFAELCQIYGIKAFNDQRSLVEAFVTRFYQLCLDRDPDPAGLKGWATALLDGSQTGSDLAYGFVFSQEFIDKNTTNEEYLMILYKAFFNRTPDQAGWDSWLAELNDGFAREDVLNGFIESNEFADLCNQFGITTTPYVPRPSVRLNVPFVPNYGQTCASSSMAMMLQYYNPDITFEDVYRRAGPPPYINYDAVDRWIREEFNLKLEVFTDRTVEDVIRCIDKGYPVMVLQVYSSIERSGHNRVITGYYLEQKKLIVNDPSDLGPVYVMSFEYFDRLWSIWDQIGGWNVSHFFWLIMPVNAEDPV